MKYFWVIGGEYTDTRFKDLAPGRTLERHGPFATYKEAYELWQTRAWATVDDCHCRFRVMEGTEAGPGEGPSVVEGTPIQQ